jgi:hypothetical protein
VTPVTPQTTNPGEGKRLPKEKAPTLRCGALGRQQVLQPAAACNELLGCGSASSSGGSSVSGSLCSVGSGCSSSRGSVGSSGSGFRSSRSCLRSDRCGSWCFHSGRSWCWSGLFLLATSGECSSSDQGGQNERVLHFDFPSWTDRILKSHGVRHVFAPVRFGTMRMACTFSAQPLIILAFSQYRLTLTKPLHPIDKAQSPHWGSQPQCRSGKTGRAFAAHPLIERLAQQHTTIWLKA